MSGFENDVPFVEDDPPRRVIPRRVKAPLGDVRRPESPWVDMAEKKRDERLARDYPRSRTAVGARREYGGALISRRHDPTSRRRSSAADGVALSALGAVVVRQRAFDVVEEPAAVASMALDAGAPLGRRQRVGVTAAKTRSRRFAHFSPSSGFKALQAFVTAWRFACSTSSLAAFTAAVMVASSLAAMA